MSVFYLVANSEMLKVLQGMQRWCLGKRMQGRRKLSGTEWIQTDRMMVKRNKACSELNIKVNL